MGECEMWRVSCRVWIETIKRCSVALILSNWYPRRARFQSSQRSITWCLRIYCLVTQRHGAGRPTNNRAGDICQDTQDTGRDGIGGDDYMAAEHAETRRQGLASTDLSDWNIVTSTLPAPMPTPMVLVRGWFEGSIRGLFGGRCSI